MTSIKINKNITKKGINIHDDTIIKTIKQMRKLGMMMVIYNETDYENFTLLKFKKKTRGIDNGKTITYNNHSH